MHNIQKDIVMSHHFSWYKFLPIYNMLNDYFQNNYSYKVKNKSACQGNPVR